MPTNAPLFINDGMVAGGSRSISIIIDNNVIIPIFMSIVVVIIT